MNHPVCLIIFISYFKNINFTSVKKQGLTTYLVPIFLYSAFWKLHQHLRRTCGPINTPKVDASFWKWKSEGM